MSRKMMIIMMIEITTSSHICLKEKKVKLLVFIVHSWLRRSRGKSNNKSDDKYNNTNINATQDQLESTRGQKWKQKENNKDNNK